MASRHRLPAPEHFQSVVEWRYARAHRYWDDCGKLIGAVEAEFPGLVCGGLQPEGFKFSGRSKGMTAALFYWDKASISQVGQGDASVPEAAARYWPIVRDVLGITGPTRVGHRTWMCFETDTPKHALRWLEGLAFWQFAGHEESALGTPQARGSVFRTTLEPGGRRVRVEIEVGTITINHRERHGVIVNVDIVAEAPGLVPDDVAEFVRWNLGFLRESVTPIFRAR